MRIYLQQFFNFLNKPKNYLLLANVLLALSLMLLNNLGVLPMRAGDLAFFAALGLVFALYRPGWTFLLFIGSIALENINLAPAEAGITLRPYQLLGALTILALVIRAFSGKLSFKIAKLKWPDWLVIGINILGFLSLINSSDKIASLKLVIILATFSALYFLVRNYIRTIDDLKKTIPFFLSSGIVVVFYGIWQNIAYLSGGNGFEAMPGRPNATFSEADWLGIFSVLLISTIYATLYYFRNDKTNCRVNSVILYFILFISYSCLILTVSRSSWLGVFAATFLFLFIILTNLKFRNWQWKEFGKQLLRIVIAAGCSIGAVYIFHLTNFELGNRVQSAGSGMQKITISCDLTKSGFVNLPDSIDNISELEKYNCRHINLEEIEKEKAKEREIREIYRRDPNVDIRTEIYQKSWQEIKRHPIFGIGWGSIGGILGLDGRGMTLNSSNIFLETWLGAGSIGLLCFVVLLIYILLRSIFGYFYVENYSQKALAIFIIISWFGLVISNLFNAGMFLGFFWLWLGITFVKLKN